MLRLKQLRKKAKVTQLKLAEYCGVTKQSVTQWESGKTEMRPEILRKVAEFFGVPIDYLIGNKPSEQPNMLTPEETEIITAFRKMNRVERDCVLKLFEKFARKG